MNYLSRDWRKGGNDLCGHLDEELSRQRENIKYRGSEVASGVWEAVENLVRLKRGEGG